MNRKKKKLLIIVLITAGLLVLMAASLPILEKLASGLSQPDFDYEFYEPDHKTNIMEDPEYLGKDTSIHYTDKTGQRIGVTDDNPSPDIGPTFFSLYFYTLQQGDAETYNSLFSEEYYKTHQPVPDFTMQRVYNIELVFLEERECENGKYEVDYTLEYNIARNDGTFRRDIASDMSRKQYVTLQYDSEGAYITKLTTVYMK